MDNVTEIVTSTPVGENTKFCKHCGTKIPAAAVVCTHCGCQVEELKGSNEQPQIVINNANTNTDSNVNTNTNVAVDPAIFGIRAKNKWGAFFLCLFMGYFGAHKFYEGKIGRGILYLCTFGLFGIGWLCDCIVLLFKPNPYYVH